MYEWIPDKTNRTAQRLVLLLFSGSAAIVLITMLIPHIPAVWIFHFTVILLLTAGIFLTARYITKMFIYRITEEGDLTVTEAASNGKRPCTVCRVGLDGIQEQILPQSAAEIKTLKKRLKRSKIKLYDYTADYQPAESIFLIVQEGGERLCIRLSYQETFAGLLRPKARSESQEETNI